MKTEGIILIIVFVVFAISLIAGTRLSKKKSGESEPGEEKSEDEAEEKQE